MKAIVIIFAFYFCSTTYADTWAQWNTWSKCTKTCGSGRQFRTRTCTKQPSNPAKCVGSNRMEQVCNPQACTGAHWNEWTSWSKCTITCGIGNERRSRKCIGGTAGSTGCLGQPEENRICVRGACTNGYWTQWGPWTGCTKTCGIGGQERRNRNCVSGASGQNCAGQKEENRVCNRGICPTGSQKKGATGQWSGWTVWAPLTGLSGRARHCVGIGCPGLDHETKPSSMVP